MEYRSFITEAFFSSAEDPEIFSSFGYEVFVKLDGDSSEWSSSFIASDANIEENSWVVWAARVLGGHEW